jgi:HK97 family phage portal protein
VNKSYPPIGRRFKAATTAVREFFFPIFGPQNGISGETPISAWGARSSNTGQVVTINTAMQISAVWACVRLIAGTISTIPLCIARRNADGSVTPQPLHPTTALVGRAPNDAMTAAQFWEAIMAAALLWGDGFAEIIRFNDKVVALNFLLPGRLIRRRLTDKGGTIEYRYTDFDDSQRVLDEKNLLRVPGISSDGVNGLSVIQFGANILGAAQAGTEVAGRIFRNGMRPSGVITVEKFLTAEQREAIRENILPTFSGSENTGKTLVLEGGMTYTGVSINPDDAQLLESRQFDVEEIARFFGVPPHLIGHMDNSTSWGTGIEQQTLGFLSFTLRPWLVRITQAIGRRMLTPGEQGTLFAEFEVDELLRADSVGRAALYSSMLQNGVYTRNEVRRRERLPAMPGGDVLTVQSNLVPLDKLGQAPPAATLPAAPNAGKHVFRTEL